VENNGVRGEGKGWHIVYAMLVVPQVFGQLEVNMCPS